MLLLKAKKEWEALSFTVNGKDFEQLKMGIDEGLVHGITGYATHSDGTMLLYGEGKVAEFKAVNPECAFLTARVVVLDEDNVRHHVDNILTAGCGVAGAVTEGTGTEGTGTEGSSYSESSLVAWMEGKGEDGELNALKVVDMLQRNFPDVVSAFMEDVMEGHDLDVIRGKVLQLEDDDLRMLLKDCTNLRNVASDELCDGIVEQWLEDGLEDDFERVAEALDMQGARNMVYKILDMYF